MPEVAQARPYVTNSGYVLELAGVDQGYLLSAEGGFATADVVVEKPGPDHIAHKHIASVKYEDVRFAVSAAMRKEFYELLISLFDYRHIQKDMAIKRVDYDQNVKSILQIFHGEVTEVSFPELDAASKEVGKLTIGISPEYTRHKKGSGKLSLAPPNRTKQWICSNFRVTIPGLDCTRISKVGALSLTVGTAADRPGEQRDYEKKPSGLQVPNLVVSLAEQNAQSFFDWHQTFVIEGKNGRDQTKDGTLEILASDLKEVLFTLKFHRLGIFRLAPDKFEATDERIRNVTAEMYCENMEFGYGPGVVVG